MNNRALSISLIVLVGLGLITGAIWFLRGSDSSKKVEVTPKEQENVLKELPLLERPYATLTPRADGKELHLIVTNLPKDAKSMEYELVYQVASGITQGVPGNVKDIKSSATVERDLLLGTCSSGKCRYDEGVEDGTFSLRFRNDKGKLVYKFETGFTLVQNPTEVVSSDGKFKMTGTLPKGHYLTMGTFGLPSAAAAPADVVTGPYGVFSKATGKVAGTVELGKTNHVFAKSWTKLEGGKTSTLGTFLATE